jgi:hypothetical protein
VGLDELVFFAESSPWLPGAVRKWSVGILALQRCELARISLIVTQKRNEVVRVEGEGGVE